MKRKEIVVSKKDIKNPTPHSDPGYGTLTVKNRMRYRSREHYLSHGGRYSRWTMPFCKMCGNRLKVNQLIVCSEECAQEAIREAKWRLAVLEKKVLRVRVS